MSERDKRALEILAIRSEKNKVGVPKDRRFLSPEQNSALADCIERGWGYYYEMVDGRLLKGYEIVQSADAQHEARPRQQVRE